MSNQPFRIGLIGAGWVAERHLEVMKAMEGIEAVGITSQRGQTAKALAQKFSIPVVAANVSELVSQTRPDALMVLVSEINTLEVAKVAMGFGLPLFLEKPPGLTLAECRELTELAESKEIATMVGFNRRHYSVFQKGREIIAQHGQLLGVAIEGHERMWKIHASSKKYDSRVIDNWLFANSTHTIDLLRYFGGDVIRGHTITHSVKERNGDQLAGIFEMSSGAIGEYKAHWYSPGGWRVVLYGDGVTVEFKPLEEGFWTDRNMASKKIEPEWYDKEFKVGFYGQMMSFRTFLAERKNTDNCISLLGSMKTMELAHSMLKNS